MSRPATASDALPLLTLALVDPSNLRRTWSGGSRRPEWRGRLGDGQDLQIDRGDEGDLLFSYGARAQFRLDPERQRLDCAPLEKGLHWQRTLISKVIPSVSVMRGYEALHAAAVDSPRGVVAIMAPSGSGKSTLAGELLHRGWPLFADDQLTLAYDGTAVHAYPGTPHMNVAESSTVGVNHESIGSTLAVLEGERWLVGHTVATQARPVRMLCLLERGEGLTLQTQALASNPLPLAPYMLGLSMDEERQRARFALYADLVESAEIIRLTAGPKDRPKQLAEQIETALSRRHPDMAGIR